MLCALVHLTLRQPRLWTVSLQSSLSSGAQNSMRTRVMPDQDAGVGKLYVSSLCEIGGTVGALAAATGSEDLAAATVSEDLAAAKVPPTMVLRLFQEHFRKSRMLSHGFPVQ